jgi:pimeloyl-ACP methyl ester carboxylesterase
MSDLNVIVNHQRIKTNGIWMHIAEQGTGPLVLLLHGFPETWYSWRHQISFLSNHGYHVVAPDLRGYGDSDSPLNPNSYTVIHLVGDLIGLLDHFGEQKVKLYTCMHSCRFVCLYNYVSVS